jgi:hypothetical protein
VTVEFLESITSSHHYFIICFVIAKDLDDERMKLDYLLRLAFTELKKKSGKRQEASLMEDTLSLGSFQKTI